jgi:hypothetical protein
LQGTQSRHTKANLAKEPALCQRTARRTPADKYLSSVAMHFSNISLLDTLPTHHPTGRMLKNVTTKSTKKTPFLCKVKNAQFITIQTAL